MKVFDDCDHSPCLGQDTRGGAAIYSAGNVTFHGTTYFLGNGFHEPDGPYSNAPPGGAALNAGYMEVERFTVGNSML